MTNKNLSKKFFNFVFAFVLVVLFPKVIFAIEEPEDFKGFVGVLLGILGLLVPTLIGLTLLVFFWGLAKYILALSGGTILGDDGKSKKDPVEDGKRLMIWGIIALFVMVSVWGIIKILTGDLLGSQFSGLPLLPESD